MKFKHNPPRLAGQLAGAMFGLLLSSGSYAATSISAGTLPRFVFNAPQSTTVQASAWFKSAFGQAGWTHFSKWGYINLKAGQKVTLAVQSNVQGLHPGVSVWWRQTGPRFAPLGFFTGHSYIQYNDVIVNNTTDESTGKKLGNFNMRLVANGYDRDGMSQAATVPANASLNPLIDGVPGLVTIKFRAKRAGTYMFVVGGINPDNTSTASGGFDNNMTRHSVSVTVVKGW